MNAKIDKLAILVFLILAVACQNLFAVNSSGRLLYRFETSVNPVLYPEDQHKYPKIILLPHVEIPLRLIDANVSKDINSGVFNSLVFKKNGELFFRWFLAPDENDFALGKETSKYNQDVLSFLQANELDSEIHREFKGYPTASTTYLVEDPNTSATFFVKASNSMAPSGTYKTKKREAWEANDARIFNDYLYGLSKEKPFKYFDFFPETGGFSLKGLNMATIVREAGDINHSGAGKIYFPAFSALDPIIGKKIAEANGSTEPEKFWKEKMPSMLANAAVELFVRTGLKLDSPHSQNYLFEMDSNFRLTGRIIFRDLADLLISQEFYERYRRKYRLDKLMQENRIYSHASSGSILISIPMTPFTSTRFNKSPLFLNHPWLPDQKSVVGEWGQIYQTTAMSAFYEFTGINISRDLNSTKISLAKYPLLKPDGFTFELEVLPESEDWTKFLKTIGPKKNHMKSCKKRT